MLILLCGLLVVVVALMEMAMPRAPQNSRQGKIVIQPQKSVGSLAPTKARIHSAITKGKQTLLPCETKGLNLSKFEHKGRDGPLMVFAEEAFHKYNRFGHFKVITAVRPAESVRNQLFFGEEPTKHNEVIMTQDSSRISVINRATKGDQQIDSKSVDRKGKHKETGPKKTSNQDSFEELLARYKSRRTRNKDLVGAEHLEVLNKLDNLYRQRKQERLKLLAPFGDLRDIQTEITASTEARDPVKELENASKQDLNDPVKLPRIRVTTVTELTKKTSLRKLDRKRLVVPREKRGALNRNYLVEDSLPRISNSGDFETVPVSLPKIH